MSQVIRLSCSLILLCLFGLAMTITPVSAEDAVTDESTDLSTDLVLTDEDVDEITDEELTEAEPSEVPEEEVDEELQEDLAGEMLLDVEGNGEVYYVDPVDGGKEYLADGTSAHRLLERAALGIDEAHFALLVQGVERDEESVCRENLLGNRLRGRIVLRVEEHGEAWWVFPRNCRAYYVGTHEAAYELMRKFSLGVSKSNLGKIRDTKRQALKRRVRLSVYAYAEDQGVSIKEAKDALKGEVKDVRACVKRAGELLGTDIRNAKKRKVAKRCLNASELPKVSKDRRVELRETIKEARHERREKKTSLRELRVEKLKARIKTRLDQKDTATE